MRITILHIIVIAITISSLGISLGSFLTLRWKDGLIALGIAILFGILTLIVFNIYGIPENFWEIIRFE